MNHLSNINSDDYNPNSENNVRNQLIRVTILTNKWIKRNKECDD